MGTRYRIFHAGIHAVASKVNYDDGVLRILCLGQSGSVLATIEFANVLLLRVTDEGNRLQLLAELGDRRGLILVDNQSPLIQWIGEESLGTRDLASAKHYLVFCGEEIVDVVSLVQPIIS